MSRILLLSLKHLSALEYSRRISIDYNLKQTHMVVVSLVVGIGILKHVK